MSSEPRQKAVRGQAGSWPYIPKELGGFRVGGFRVWGLGFGVWGLGFGVKGLGYRVEQRVGLP